jgi:hypothetical protein
VSTPEPVSRRTTLAGLAALTGAVLTGCTGTQPSAGPRPTPRSPGSPATGRPADAPDVRLAATVLGAEQMMLARVLATIHRHPGLAGRLAGARAAHRAHVALLAGAVPAGAGPTASPDGPSGHPPGHPAVPASSTGALAALRRSEDRLARANRSSALAAESGAFARALGSMAAAAAQQVAHLAPATGDR